MPRRPRVDQPGVPQHVIQRGNNRGACFFADDDDYCYLHWLRKAAYDHHVDVHAYVLMTTHVHLLATPARPGTMATMMQSLGRRYVRYVNATCKRSGTLWESRYKAGAVDAEAYLRRVYRYIELNPVRANMVTHQGEYPWSSFAVNGGGKQSEWLKPHALYLALAGGAAERREAYAALFRSELDPEETARIRTAVNLGIGVDDARFCEQRRAAEQAKRNGGRKGKGAHSPTGEQVDLF